MKFGGILFKITENSNFKVSTLSDVHFLKKAFEYTEIIRIPMSPTIESVEIPIFWPKKRTSAVLAFKYLMYVAFVAKLRFIIFFDHKIQWSFHIDTYNFIVNFKSYLYLKTPERYFRQLIPYFARILYHG